MLQQKSKPQKMVSIVARAGFGGRIRTQLPLADAKTSTPDELLEQVIEQNLSATNPTQRGIAHSLQNIRNESACDIDMRVHASSDKINITHLRKHTAIEEEFSRKEIEDETVDEIELVAAKVALGGRHAG